MISLLCAYGAPDTATENDWNLTEHVVLATTVAYKLTVRIFARISKKVSELHRDGATIYYFALLHTPLAWHSFSGVTKTIRCMFVRIIGPLFSAL